MKIFLLDVDNTLAPFQPTAELYKRVFLKKKNFKYYFLGYFMIVLLKLFWFSPIVVEFQRKLIMSLLSKVDPDELKNASDQIADVVVGSYNNGFRKVLNYYKQKDDKIYLLTHCPDLIARRIIELLGFDGEYSISIKDYLKTKERPMNINKLAILKRIKAENPSHEIYYFADDLIDLKCLLSADQGILANADFFTKLIRGLFFRRVKVWG